MGKHFGELAYIRGIIYYKLSPFEQKPFAGVIRYGVPNTIRRTAASIKYWLPQFVVGYLIYYYAEAANWQSKRKNPRDYMFEVDPNPPKVCKRVVEPVSPCNKNELSAPEPDASEICDDD